MLPYWVRLAVERRRLAASERYHQLRNFIRRNGGWGSWGGWAIFVLCILFSLAVGRASNTYDGHPHQLLTEEPMKSNQTNRTESSQP